MTPKKLHTEYGVLISMMQYFIMNLSCKARDSQNSVFVIHACGISLLLPFVCNPHTKACYVISFEHFLSHLCFHNIGISFLCNKNSELLIVPPVNGLFLSNVSGLSFHTEIT